MRKGHVLLIFSSVGALIFFPALNSFFYWDDFPLMCMSRYIGNPLHFFIQDYFPGSLCYRPLGMLSWWLSYKVFGLNSTLHNLVNPLLHVINTFLVYLLLHELFGQRRWIILFSSLLFLIHPVTVSTSIYQSDRFDLIATLFILLTLYFFLRFLSTRQRRYFVYSLFTTFLGILSKEISYGLALLITLIVVTFPKIESNGQRSRKVALLLPYYLTTFFLLALRYMLLRGAESHYFNNGLIHSLWNGFSRWVHLMPDIYLFHVDVLGIGDVVNYFFLLWVLLLVVILFLSVKEQRPIPWYLMLFGLGVIGISGFLMTPATNLITLVNPGRGFSFFLIAEGRFYYLSLVGILIILNSSLFLVFPFFYHHRRTQLYSALMLSSFMITFFFYSISSFSLSQKWKDLTNGRERQVVELAGQIIQHTPLIEDGMKIYFLNTQPHSHFREFSDTMLKSIAPLDSKVIHCLVFTEKPPWYNLVLKEDMEKMEIQPLGNMRFRGREYPPSVAGGYAHFYLRFPDGDDITKDERAIFFEWLTEEKRFTDVTEKVRTGIMKVQFFNDRPES